MDGNKQTCVLILGMHRSGSSFLSGIMSILGVDLGNKLLMPDDFNQKGFFEHPDIMNLNMDFLTLYGLDPDGVNGKLPFTWPQEEPAHKLKENIKEIVKKDFSQSKIFGIKDPRISVLLPVYIEALRDLGIDFFILVSKREMQNVVSSLHKRGVVSLSDAVKAYKHYYLTINAFTDYLPHKDVDYDELLSQPEKIINEILLEIGNPNLKSYDSVRDRIDIFLETNLRHNNISIEDFVLEITNKIKFLEGELSDLKRTREQDMIVIKENNHLLTTKENTLREILFDKNKIFNNYLQVKSNYDEYKHLNHNQHKHIQYLECLLRERDSHVLELNSVISNIERSIVWKFVKGWDVFLSLFFPRGSVVRNSYEGLIRSIQTFLNDVLPHKLFRFIKKSNENPDVKHEDTFWDKFLTEKPETEILFINHEETRTGAPRIIFDIAKFFKEKNKISVVSLARGSMNTDFKEEFSPVIYPNDLYKGITTVEKAKIVLEKVKPKLVYANSIGSHPFCIAAKEMNIPVIFHVHELDIAIKVMFRGGSRENFKNLADKFIAVSTPVYNFLVNDLSCSIDDVILIHEFVDREKIKEKSLAISKEEVDIELNRKNNEVIVLGLGTFIYRKGADMFMKLAKNLKKKGLNCKFVWIGSRPFKEPFMADFDFYSQHFTLLQEKINPFPYLKNADIFVLPSREDPFPLVILEAMALGKPSVIFKEGGGIYEAVKDSGLIVSDFNIEEFANQVENLILNSDQRIELGDKAIDYQKDYDASVILPNIESVVNLILKKDEN